MEHLKKNPITQTLDNGSKVEVTLKAYLKHLFVEYNS